MTTHTSSRHAGILLPLFSGPSTRSWGIGEILDLVPLCAWLDRAGCNLLLLLPVNEMATGGHSPYSAISAMAIDPIYISVWALEDVTALGGEASLSERDCRQLAEARQSRGVDYHAVRDLKERVLRRAFERFVAEEWSQESPRAAGLATFRREEAWWLDDYALFRALRARHREQAWWDWDAGLAMRDAEALEDVHDSLGEEILYRQYLQWVANAQWQAARKRVAPVALFGDLPFMVGRDSADVWARQHAFDVGATIGTPPDAFSETGQDWGLPVYRWPVFARENDAWISERATRAAELFAGYRVDHVVGFYRTYVIPADGSPRFFVPPDEPSQLAQGERLMRAFMGPGAKVVAEDLGTVPDFVRASLLRLDVPGYKVLRWEREWNGKGQPFRDPMTWPTCSVATTGTHDTETLAEWWETADQAERRAVAAIPFLAARDLPAEDARLTPRVRDMLLELMFASASDLLVLPVQDVFGWRDRVNTPATVSDDNWTWRLPWPVDELDREPVTEERAASLRRWALRYGRNAARP
jgi:4-alpha-glucanotransferase